MFFHAAFGESGLPCLLITYPGRPIRILTIDSAAPNKKMLADLPMRDRAALRAEMARVDGGIDTVIEIECEACGTPIRTRLESEPSFLFLTARL
ncbi:hypothetical protein LLG95_06150 [bacterium]|nr:hypothetical protein [bacterium]